MCPDQAEGEDVPGTDYHLSISIIPQENFQDKEISSGAFTPLFGATSCQRSSQ